MKIHGLQKMTLLDFPGRVACKVFLGGCDFRCPFCHNFQLIDGSAPPVMEEEELLAFLRKRKGLLEGVAFTGGEPCLRPELPDLMARIREMGFGVKLDTNGNHPARLSALDLGPIRESVALLLEGKTDYEFRTTVVDELHEGADFEAVGQWIAGAKRYFLQSFTDREAVPFGGLHAPSKENLREYREIAAKYVPETRLRGVD